MWNGFIREGVEFSILRLEGRAKGNWGYCEQECEFLPRCAPGSSSHTLCVLSSGRRVSEQGGKCARWAKFGRHLRPCPALRQPNRIPLRLVVRALCVLAQCKMQMRKRRWEESRNEAKLLMLHLFCIWAKPWTRKPVYGASKKGKFICLRMSLGICTLEIVFIQIKAHEIAVTKKR